MTTLAIWTDDVDDAEVGCVLFSKTHTRAGDWPRGGVVIRVEKDFDDSVLSVTVLEWHGAGVLQTPSTFDIPRVDIAEPGDRFFSADARNASDALMRWASSRRGPKDPGRKAWWVRVACDLAEAASETMYLKGAEMRYQRAQAAKRDEWAALPTSNLPVPAGDAERITAAELADDEVAS